MKKIDLKKPLHLPLEKVTVFLNGRTAREKHLFIGFFVVLLLVLDYLLILAPTLAVFQTLGPKTAELQKSRQELIEDRDGAAAIHKRWTQVKELAETEEKATIDSTAAAALLESLSDQARQTGVKITSVKPVETPKVKSGTRYAPLPIKLSGLGGTHELGRFLSRLESGPTFFRVTELNIVSSPLNERRHQIDLSLEACQKLSAPPAGGGS